MTDASTIHVGDVREILPTIADDSINCCVTSPPYWGLRDYGVDGQLGLEPTPDEYIARMVAVFREVWRVLRDDGTLWLNLGDSYIGGYSRGPIGKSTLQGGQASQEASRNAPSVKRSYRRDRHETGCTAHRVAIDLKPKDLYMMPARVAIALQADGWYLRSDIIWNKPNPMPESVRDRPTQSHEHLFLLSKSRRYYYDGDAIREPARYIGPNAPGRSGSPSEQNLHRIAGRNKRAGGMPSGWDTGPGGHPDLTGRYDKAYNQEFDRRTRNKRSVWTISTMPFPEAHFATFPEDLVEPCVLAGCPTGGAVLDPFMGSGTTGVVACRLGRRFMGVEINPEYAAMAERRIAPHRNQLQIGAE